MLAEGMTDRPQIWFPQRGEVQDRRLEIPRILMTTCNQNQTRRFSKYTPIPAPSFCFGFQFPRIGVKPNVVSQGPMQRSKSTHPIISPTKRLFIGSPLLIFLSNANNRSRLAPSGFISALPYTSIKYMHKSPPEAPWPASSSRPAPLERRSIAAFQSWDLTYRAVRTRNCW